jgi:L-fuconolactonase
MIIDAHHHLWDLGKGYAWLDDPAMSPIRRTFAVDDLRGEISAAGVDYTILVEAAREDSSEVQDFLELASGTPEIAGVIGWVDLTAPALPTSPGLVGARAQVQAQPDPDYLARPGIRRGLQLIQDRNLTYDLVIRPDQLPAAAGLAEAMPGLTLVLDHLGKPSIRDGQAGLTRWRALLAPLAARQNTYAKLSGLVTEADWAHWTHADLAPFIDTALELFGPRRLMFGSDWPVCLLASSYQGVMAALAESIRDLSRAEQDEIYSGTAIRAYRLVL